MTNPPNDGGPAFPTDTKDKFIPTPDGGMAPASHYGWEPHEGMSLRHYFAAKFAAAWTVALSARWREDGCDDRAIANEAARLGLWQAEAMLSIIPRSK